MNSKNSLSAIKLKKEQTLPQTPTARIQEPAEPLEKKSQPEPQGRRVGRRKKPAKEKENKTISLRFTEAEYRAIEEKAGLVPLATFLKHELKQRSDIL